MGLLLAGTSMLSTESKAQVRVGVQINIGEQPRWRAPGYDYVEYYYLPEIDCYYYVPRHQFVYLSGNRWIFSASLPYRYRSFDLYGARKVVINQPRAYLYYRDHRDRYGYRNDRHDNGRHRGWDRGRGHGRH